ncbi:MAG: YvcK family protein [Aquificaceae bacterium]|nr:YvcK family protein [Aquificaceae bacterium]MDW8237069.1 YvcK family protein [Aquificaceae bacterium]
MKIVAIGGGTGLSTLLRGLKEKVGNQIFKLSAIVTVADSGGSTGRLRKAYTMPAPGDIRNCIAALSESEEIIKALFQYRFSKGECDGHAFGNLLLVALTDITGSFLQGVSIASQILRTKGEIIPSTAENVELWARFEDGKEIMGEEEITKYGKESLSKIERVWIEPKEARAPDEAIQRLSEADMIVFGPGSLYTSVLPNLLVEDIKKTIQESNALKVFVVNAMTQPGETTGYTAFDHLERFLTISGLSQVNAVIVNTRMPSDRILRNYLENSQEPVIPDVSKIARAGVKVYTGDLIGEKEDFVRHDPQRLAELLLSLLPVHESLS